MVMWSTDKCMSFDQAAQTIHYVFFMIQKTLKPSKNVYINISPKYTS